MSNYTSLAIGAVAGLVAFLVINARMNYKIRLWEKERKYRAYPSFGSPPTRDEKQEPELATRR